MGRSRMIAGVCYAQPFDEEQQKDGRFCVVCHVISLSSGVYSQSPAGSGPSHPPTSMYNMYKVDV